MPPRALCTSSAQADGGAIDGPRFAKLISELSPPPGKEALGPAFYYRTLFRLQCELVKLQDWVLHQKLKIVVLLEGRDAAGKGGMIKRITQRCAPTALHVPGIY